MRGVFKFIRIEFLRNTFYNLKYCAGMIIVAVFLGNFIAFIFLDSNKFVNNDTYLNYLFFVAISASFLGILKGIYDIYGDRDLFRKFSRGGLRVLDFFIAKLIIASLVGVIQCYFLTSPGDNMFNSSNEIYSLVISTHMIICLAIFMCSYTMALIASCIVTDAKTASISIALLLVPQIMLSGMVPYNQLHKSVFLWESDYDKMPPLASIFPVPLGFEALVTANYILTVDEYGDDSMANNHIKSVIAKEEDGIKLKNSVFRSVKGMLGNPTWILDLTSILILGFLYFCCAYLFYKWLNKSKFKDSNKDFIRK